MLQQISLFASKTSKHMLMFVLFACQKYVKLLIMIKLQDLHVHIQDLCACTCIRHGGGIVDAHNFAHL